MEIVPLRHKNESTGRNSANKPLTSKNLKKLHTLIAELSRAFEEITRKSADLRGN